MKRTIFFLFHIVLLTGLLGCGGGGSGPDVADPSIPVTEFMGNGGGVQRVSAPVIKPGHLLKVRVLTRRAAEVEIDSGRVKEDGTIALPLVGDVPVAEMELKEAENVLVQEYSQFLKDPQVTLEFVFDKTGDSAVSPWGQVTVLGCVKKPGPVAIPPTGELTVIGAIQLAGGVDVGAKMKDVKVSRPQPDGGNQEFTVNLLDFSGGNRLTGQFPLKRGDMVFVAEGLF
jgi:polysaccharide export outer membrane protein